MENKRKLPFQKDYQETNADMLVEKTMRVKLADNFMDEKTERLILGTIIKRKDLNMRWLEIEQLVNNTIRPSDVFLTDKKQDASMKEFITRYDNVLQTDNILSNCIDQKVAHTLINQVQLNIEPTGISLRDVDLPQFGLLSDTVSDLINHGLTLNDLEQNRKRDLYMFGVSYVALDTNGNVQFNFEGSDLNSEISMTKISPIEVYSDPMARSLDNSNYVFIMSRVNSENTINLLRGLPGVREDVLDAIEENYYLGQNETVDGMTRWLTNEMFFTDIIVEEDFTERMEFISYFHRKINPKTKQIDVEVRTFCGRLEVREPIWLGTATFPLSASYCSKEDMRFYGISPALKCYQWQKQLNFLSLLKQYVLINYSLPGFFVDKDAATNLNRIVNALSLAGVIIPLETNGKPIQSIITEKQVPQASLQVLEAEMQLLSNKITASFGITPLYDGQSGMSVGKTGAMEMAINQINAIDNFIKLNDITFVKSLALNIYNIIKKRRSLIKLNYMTNLGPSFNAGLITKEFDPKLLDNVGNVNINFLSDIFYVGEDLSKNIAALANQLASSANIKYFNPLYYIMLAKVPDKRDIISQYLEKQTEEATQKAQLFIQLMTKEIELCGQNAQPDGQGGQQAPDPNAQAILQTLVGIITGQINSQELQQVAQSLMQRFQQEAQQQQAQQQQQQSQQNEQQQNTPKTSQQGGASAPQPNSQGGM